MRNIDEECSSGNTFRSSNILPKYWEILNVTSGNEKVRVFEIKATCAIVESVKVSDSKEKDHSRGIYQQTISGFN